MQALIEGRRLPVVLISTEEWGVEGPHTGLNLGPLEDGIDWKVHCPKLKVLLLEGAQKTSRTSYQNNPLRLSVAADYIEEYQDSVSVYRQWGNKTLPPTTEFLALVLRSVVK